MVATHGWIKSCMYCYKQLDWGTDAHECEPAKKEENIAAWKEEPPPWILSERVESGMVRCTGACGDLNWTIVEYGIVCHKHACRYRRNPWCQTHPDGCPEE